MALSLFSTCGPKTSLRSDIFPAPSTSRLESWNIAWLNFRRTAKSSPIAVAPILSFEAVAALRVRGYLVHRLEDGYPEWKAAGLPIEAVA